MLSVALALVGVSVGLFATWLTWKGIQEARISRELLRFEEDRAWNDRHFRAVFKTTGLNPSNIYISNSVDAKIEDIELELKHIDGNLKIGDTGNIEFEGDARLKKKALIQEASDALEAILKKKKPGRRKKRKKTNRDLQDAWTSFTAPRLPRTDLPNWTMAILGSEDGERYRKEFGAHLYELIQAGELKQARRDRRRMIRAVLWLAVAIRAHRALTRARPH